MKIFSKCFKQSKKLTVILQMLISIQENNGNFAMFLSIQKINGFFVNFFKLWFFFLTFLRQLKKRTKIENS